MIPKTADFSDKIMPHDQSHSIDQDKTAGNADCNNITEECDEERAR
jgi:hypothetical protein